ncbi:hypothetical protein N3K63_03425 [Microbacterium sp. W1N]|uniref:hypothetical protein n=1 Tax=Microbacterium festucae TaxID=2977531 RepID=UPI0021BF2B6B|nr:hypothetical protein [Microbacterium festucae]MCT9819332.1 hypothetical protein [Microbacterium festucae]
MIETEVETVELLGTFEAVAWERRADGLHVTLPDHVDLDAGFGLRVSVAHERWPERRDFLHGDVLV